MKIVFLSNYYNHHQAPFCNAMFARVHDSFTFVQTKEMEAERISMGWGEELALPFIKKSYGSLSAQAECQALVEDADVVIIGSAPESMVENRIRNGKIVVRYQERPLKKKPPFWKIPYQRFRLHQKNPRNGKIYLLCASAYTASDYAKFGLFQNKSYRWGYFPEVKKYPDVNTMIAQKESGSLLWVARFIDWKHPELPVLIAKRLKEEGYKFHLQLIGNGVLEEKIRVLINELGLADCVKMLGTMKPWQVREHMEHAQIFLFTSDRNEGWGAVLNEAMNSGCGVVACDAIGSVPYLIRDGENGFMYKDGDFEDLYSKVKQLLDAPHCAARLGKMAYETMISEWNAETAADRLLLLLDDLQKYGDSYRYSHGPCSKD